MTGEAGKLVLVAPLAGWCTPLDELPDPVFATRMLGDGVAIDPTSPILHAPCAGEIVALPASRHAVTVRAGNGAEILLHVGIDTVGLRGEGFEALVEKGDAVAAGTPLLRFDLDGLAQRARSLLTPVIVVNAGYSIASRVANASVRVGDCLLELQKISAVDGGEIAARGAPFTTSVAVTVGLAHGLHARPAARIAQAVRARGAEVSLAVNGRAADARSVTALMALGVRRGDNVVIHSRGAQAADATAAVAAVLADEGDPSLTPDPSPERAVGSASLSPADVAVAPVSAGTTARTQGIVRGVVASRGLAVGTAHHLRATRFEVPEHGAGLAHEAAAFELARQAVRASLAVVRNDPNTVRREVAEAHLMLLEDPALVDTAERAIGQGSSAGYAWRSAVQAQVTALEKLDDGYLRERAADLRDLEAQILTALGLRPADSGDALPERAIVIADELLPSQFAALDSARLAGICTAGGGPTSHVAIMASALGVPMVVAGGDEVRSVPESQLVILDANAGELHVTPDPQRVVAAERQIESDSRRRQAERGAAQSDAHTADGQRIRVFANLGSTADAIAARELGAEGCGLLRTEFLFLEQHTAPSEEQQLAAYQRIATTLGGRPLTIRTLDIGGDKPIEYLPLPHEANPALGLRGVRTSLWRPDLLRVQLRAILRVQPAGQCRILLPMITDAGEIAAVRAELTAAMAAVGVETAPALGVMIETPAAAMLADTLAPHVDFFSIGTNDLTQYTLAMDRGHPQLAARVDGLHPAVLRLIERTAQAAVKQGREVAVCGNLALDPAAIAILIGLDVHELSVAHAAVPAVKARIASLHLDSCRATAARALQCSTAAEVRAIATVPS